MQRNELSSNKNTKPNSQTTFENVSNLSFTVISRYIYIYKTYNSSRNMIWTHKMLKNVFLFYFRKLFFCGCLNQWSETLQYLNTHWEEPWLNTKQWQRLYAQDLALSFVRSNKFTSTLSVSNSNKTSNLKLPAITKEYACLDSTWYCSFWLRQY